MHKTCYYDFLNRNFDGCHLYLTHALTTNSTEFYINSEAFVLKFLEIRFLYAIQKDY